MLHFHILVISLTQMFVGYPSVSNMDYAQFDLVLPAAVVATFPLFDVLFNVVQFASTAFPFPLPLGLSSPLHVH